MVLFCHDKIVRGKRMSEQINIEKVIWLIMSKDRKKVLKLKAKTKSSNGRPMVAWDDHVSGKNKLRLASYTSKSIAQREIDLGYIHAYTHELEVVEVKQTLEFAKGDT